MRLRLLDRAAFRLLIGLAVCSAAVGCSESAAEPSGADTIAVTMALAAPSAVQHVPVILADRLGFFTDEGLEVELVDFQAGSKVLAALLAGDADVASGFYGDTIKIAAQGKALRSVITTTNSVGVALAVSPVTERQIDDVADLKGATVGVSAPGSGTHVFLNYLLERAGVDVKDVAVAGIGLAATAVAATERGQVDAAVLLDPALSQLQQRAEGLRVLVDTRDPVTASEIFETETFPAISLFTRSDWLADNPEAARKIAAATLRALRWIAEHSAAEIADAMPPEYAQPDRALYVATIEKAKPVYSVDGRMDVGGAEAIRRFLIPSSPEVAGAGTDLATTFTNDLLR